MYLIFILTELVEKETIENFIKEKKNTKSCENVPVNRKNQYSTVNKQSDRTHIGTIKIDYLRKELYLSVKANDDPYELAFSFVTKYNLPKKNVSLIVQKINLLLQTHLKKFT